MEMEDDGGLCVRMLEVNVLHPLTSLSFITLDRRGGNHPRQADERAVKIL